MNTFSDLSKGTRSKNISNFVVWFDIRAIIQMIEDEILFLKDHASHFVGQGGSTYWEFSVDVAIGIHLALSRWGQSSNNTCFEAVLFALLTLA